MWRWGIARAPRDLLSNIPLCFDLAYWSCVTNCSGKPETEQEYSQTRMALAKTRIRSLQVIVFANDGIIPKRQIDFGLGAGLVVKK